MLFESWAQVSARDREALEQFMNRVSGVFLGAAVLDYGCGRQPYADLVQRSGGTYYGYDDPSFPDSHVDQPIGTKETVLSRRWDVIICNEVISLVDSPEDFLFRLRELVGHGGTLVLTYTMGWRQYHKLDRWRFTPAGIEDLLDRNHFSVETHVQRGTLDIAPDFLLPTGFGVVARAT